MTMFKRVSGGLAAFAVMAAGAAHATDLGTGLAPVHAPAHHASAQSWTGHYVGGTAGYGWSGGAIDHDGATSNPIAGSGALLGVTLGYNHQFGPSWVAGVEGDLSWSGMTGSFPAGSLGQPNGDPWTCSGPCFSGLTWLATLRGRVGPTFGQFLPYVTGGLAVGGIKAGMETSPEFDVNGHAFGWTAGAGIEVALHSGWSLKAEYLHVDLGFTQPTAVDNISGDQKADIIRFGVNYRFGGHQAPISVGY